MDKEPQNQALPNVRALQENVAWLRIHAKQVFLYADHILHSKMIGVGPLKSAIVAARRVVSRLIDRIDYVSDNSDEVDDLLWDEYGPLLYDLAESVAGSNGEERALKLAAIRQIINNEITVGE